MEEAAPPDTGSGGTPTAMVAVPMLSTALGHLHYTHNMPGEPPPVHTKIKKKVVAIDEAETE